MHQVWSLRYVQIEPFKPSMGINVMYVGIWNNACSFLHVADDIHGRIFRDLHNP